METLNQKTIVFSSDEIDDIVWSIRDVIAEVDEVNMFTHIQVLTDLQSKLTDQKWDVKY